MSHLDPQRWPKCPLCGLKQPRGGFKCPHCPPDKNISFSYNIQLMVHLRDIHHIQIPRRVPCELCSRDFPDTDAVLEHVLIDEHACTSDHLTCHCEVMFQFDTEEHLSQHQLAHAPVVQPLPPYSMHSNPVNLFPYSQRQSNLLPSSNHLIQAQPTNLTNPVNLGYYYRSPFPNPLQAPSPLFHVNVNTNFYPPSLAVTRLGLSRPLAPLNQSPVVPQVSSYLQGSITPAEINEGKETLSIDVTNAAAKMLVARGNATAGIHRECYSCGSKPAFKDLTSLQLCNYCPKAFMSTLQACLHSYDRHEQSRTFLSNTTMSCPGKNCSSMKSTSTLGEIFNHFKAVHMNDDCLYHYVCQRSTCRGVFGTLKGINSHEVYCKAHYNKFYESVANYLQCTSCRQYCYSFSCCECPECSAVLANEKDLGNHLWLDHCKPMTEITRVKSLSFNSCKFHFVCFRMNCRLVFNDSIAYRAHRKLNCSSEVGGSKPLAILPSKTQEQLNAVRDALRRKLASHEKDKEKEDDANCKTLKRSAEDDDDYKMRRKSRFSDADVETESVEVTIKQEFKESEEDIVGSGLDLLERTLKLNDGHKLRETLEMTSSRSELANDEDEYKALMDNPAASSAWDEAMENLLSFTDT